MLMRNTFMCKYRIFFVYSQQIKPIWIYANYYPLKIGSPIVKR